MKHKDVLNEVYNKALEKGDNACFIELLPEVKSQLELIVLRAELNKGLITVLITLLTHKIVNASQDIRFHQAQQNNGFSGRSIDKEVVTPFMKSVGFPSMSESGWLTRSLEQPHPYTLDYPGKIKPDALKKAFLDLIDHVQTNKIAPDVVLLYLFTLLIKQRESVKLELAKPHSLSIISIIRLLEKHFTFKYKCSGASRLPTLAIYAIYLCMMKQITRYKNKILCSLEKHNCADLKSGSVGDIEIDNDDGSVFEGVEIKHELSINKQIILNAYEKFKSYNTTRYYILTTLDMKHANWDDIEQEVKRIQRIHGCQVIVNGVYSTLGYYSRLITDTSEFIKNYVDLLKVDSAVKFQHKVTWNNLVGFGV